MKRDYIGTINSIKNIAKDVFEIKILSDLDNILPGQFISIKCENTTLRRPFSVCDFDKKNNLIKILFKLKGKGTTYLKSLKINDKIDFLAPLGNGFNIINKNSLLVGAGIGISPILFLKKEMDRKNIKNYMISGFKTNEDIIYGSDENIIGGSVLDNLDNLIKEKNIEIIYSCGPRIVLENISKLAIKYNIDSYLAIEKEMACQIGVCHGCAIRLKIDNQIISKTVCHDGPVFRGNEIIWE